MVSPRRDFEDRLVRFAVNTLAIVDNLPSYPGSRVLAGQLARSSTSPALNYGEAQAAESDRDFIHKLKLCLKELRESQVSLKIIKGRNYFPENDLIPVLGECSELVAMFTASVQKKRMNIEKKTRK